MAPLLLLLCFDGENKTLHSSLMNAYTCCMALPEHNNDTLGMQLYRAGHVIFLLEHRHATSAGRTSYNTSSEGEGGRS